MSKAMLTKAEFLALIGTVLDWTPKRTKPEDVHLKIDGCPDCGLEAIMVVKNLDHAVSIDCSGAVEQGRSVHEIMDEAEASLYQSNEDDDDEPEIGPMGVILGAILSGMKKAAMAERQRRGPSTEPSVN